MTVQELITALQQQRPEAMVLVDAQDIGYHTVASLEVVDVVLNAQEDSGFEGPHVDAFGHKKDRVTQAVRIRPLFNVEGYSS